MGSRSRRIEQVAAARTSGPPRPRLVELGDPSVSSLPTIACWPAGCPPGLDDLGRESTSSSPQDASIRSSVSRSLIARGGDRAGGGTLQFSAAPHRLTRCGGSTSAPARVLSARAVLISSSLLSPWVRIGAALPGVSLCHNVSEPRKRLALRGIGVAVNREQSTSSRSERRSLCATPKRCPAPRSRARAPSDDIALNPSCEQNVDFFRRKVQQDALARPAFEAGAISRSAGSRETARLRVPVRWARPLGTSISVCCFRGNGEDSSDCALVLAKPTSAADEAIHRSRRLEISLTTSIARSDPRSRDTEIRLDRRQLVPRS